MVISNRTFYLWDVYSSLMYSTGVTWLNDYEAYGLCLMSLQSRSDYYIHYTDLITITLSPIRPRSCSEVYRFRSLPTDFCLLAAKCCLIQNFKIFQSPPYGRAVVVYTNVLWVLSIRSYH